MYEIYNFNDSRISLSYSDWCANKASLVASKVAGEQVSDGENNAAYHASMAVACASNKANNPYDAAGVASRVSGSAVRILCRAGLNVYEACAVLDVERFRVLDCLKAGEDPYPLNVAQD